MTLSRLCVAIALSLLLAACGERAAYRYKLTLSVDTSDGVRTASTVAEVLVYAVSIPDHGAMHKLTAEALYLDLGEGRRPLIALLTSFLNGNKPHWSRDGGPNTDFELGLYGQSTPHGETAFDQISRLSKFRGPKAIEPEDLPDLVTFADTADPKSVIAVDPNDLTATLGPNIKWRAITLEATDEPITRSIADKLPWLKNMSSLLDGTEYNVVANKALSNKIGTDSFIHPKRED